MTNKKRPSGRFVFLCEKRGGLFINPQWFLKTLAFLGAFLFNRYPMGGAAAGIAENDVIDADTLCAVCVYRDLDNLASFVDNVAKRSAVGNSEPPTSVLFGEERFIHTVEAGI
jgi:hypothetical protein